MTKNVSVFLLVLFVFGCASSHVYREVMKEESTFNSRSFPVPPEQVYQAVIRAVLGKNFMLEKEDPENNFLLAKRSFQKGKRTTALLLQTKISPAGRDQSMVYFSAIETKETSYVSDRTRFLLWIVPLPGGGGKEASRVKEGEEVVQDPKFYENMFSAVEKELAAVVEEKEEKVEESASDGLEENEQEDSEGMATNRIAAEDGIPVGTAAGDPVEEFVNIDSNAD